MGDLDRGRDRRRGLLWRSCLMVAVLIALLLILLLTTAAAPVEFEVSYGEVLAFAALVSFVIGAVFGVAVVAIVTKCK